MLVQEVDYDIPTESEWERLKFYSSRIRRIEYVPHTYHATTLEKTQWGDSWATIMDCSVDRDLREFRRICRALAPRSSQPLFPNLQHVEFPQLGFAIQCLDIFLRGKNISLSLRWGDVDSKPEHDESLATFFDIIEKQSLQLQELDLGSFGDRGAAESASLSKVVQKMKNLRSLACGSRKLTSTALHTLAKFPNLHKLQIPNNSADLLQATTMSKTIFPLLQHLTIREDSLLSFATFLGNMPHPVSLRTLTVYLTKLNDPTHLQKLLHNLSRRVEKLGDVDGIVFKYVKYGVVMRSAVEVDHPPTVYAQMLEPLLRFRNLTHLNLDVPWLFSLSDDDMEAMASAWPRLRFLQIGSKLGWGTPHLVTPKGLMSLLKGCRDLQHLSFSFNAELEPPDVSMITRDHVNTQIDYLYVGDSPLPLHNISRLAVFLQHIFPKLSGVGGCWLMSGNRDWGSMESAIRETWDAMVDIINIRNHTIQLN